MSKQTCYYYDSETNHCHCYRVELDMIEKAKLLDVENAKLRELVRDWRALAVCGADSLSDWIEIQADLESRMRELGVEVD